MEKFDINLCAIPKFLLEQLFVNIRMLQRIVFWIFKEDSRTSISFLVSFRGNIVWG